MKNKKKKDYLNKINSFFIIPNSRKKEKNHPDTTGYGRDENGRIFRLDGWKLEMGGKHKGKTFVAGNLNYLKEEFQNNNHLKDEDDDLGFDINDL